MSSSPDGFTHINRSDLQDMDTLKPNDVAVANDATANDMPTSVSPPPPPAPGSAAVKDASPLPSTPAAATKAGSGSGFSASAGAGSSSGTDDAKPGQGCCVAAVKSAYAVVHPYVSWETPAVTGAALAAVVVFYTTFFVLEFSFASALLNTGVVVMAASGAAVLAKPYYPLPFPPPPSDTDFSGHTDVVADGVRATMTMTLGQYMYFRHLMMWENKYESVRALAVLLLLANNAWLFSPCTVFLATLALFVVPALYNRQQAAVQNAMAAANPHLHKVADMSSRLRAGITAKTATLAFCLGLALMWFMSFVTVSTWLLMSAWTLVLLEVLPTLRPKAA